MERVGPVRLGFGTGSRAQHAARGQFLPVLAVGIVTMCVFSTFAVDLGYWRYQQRLAQSAADSAAVAGAIRLNFGTSADTTAQTTPDSAAQAAAARLGFVDGSGGAVVAVSPTPPPPPRPGATPYPPNTAIEVKVSRALPGFFSAIMGQAAPTVSGRAVAVQTNDSTICLYQTQMQGAGGHLTFKGNKPVQVVNCGVAANGPITASFANTTIVSSFAGTGGISSNGPVTKLPAPISDPCFKIPACAYVASQPVPPLSGSAVDATQTTALTAPAAPGYSVVTNCCSTAGTVFGPGLYYVYGGMTGKIVSDGATIVNVDGTFSAQAGGGSSSFFSGPGSGPTAHLAFYQPPSNTNSITFNGGGNQTTQWNGTFYAPTAAFVSNGGSVTFSNVVIGSIRDNGGGSGQGIVVDPTLSGQVPPAYIATKVVIDQ